MVFVFSEGYALGAPSYTTCPDANFSELANLPVRIAQEVAQVGLEVRGEN